MGTNSIEARLTPGVGQGGFEHVLQDGNEHRYARERAAY